MKANRPRPRMALATSRKVASLSEDDQRLLEALEVAGFDVRPLVWDESRPARREFDCVVIRSCWDYHLRPAQFLDWISELERGDVVVWNPPQPCAGITTNNT